MVFESESDYRDALVERGGRRDMGPDEYAAMLTERFVPHGTPDMAAAAVERMEAAGVGRYYVQEYAHLDEVDTSRLDVVFEALSAS